MTNIKVMKDKTEDNLTFQELKRLQVYSTQEPEMDPELEKCFFSFAIKDIIRPVGKTEQDL